MSRHRVKNLDYELDDELDDFEGGYEDDSQMQESLVKARAALGEGFADTEIQDSLWHYYYDVDKAVHYLLGASSPRFWRRLSDHAADQRSTTRPSVKKNTPKKPKGRKLSSAILCIKHYHSRPDGVGCWYETQCQLEASPTLMAPEESASIPFRRRLAQPCTRVLATSFFSDCPWLAVPPDRLATLTPIRATVAGLLGGSSSDPPKKSKLAALAEARRKRKVGKTSASSSTPSSVALLDTLSSRQATDENPKPRERPVFRTRAAAEQPTKPNEPQKPTSHPEPPSETPEPSTPGAVLASPSAFAQTLIGNDASVVSSNFDPLSAYTGSVAFAENAFSGPSPDDVVAQAQSASKSLGGGQKPKASKEITKPPKGTKKAKDVTSAVADMTVNDPPRPKSPKTDKVNVAAEYARAQGKRTANFVVIGKSTNQQILEPSS